jgi:hypothetical protein
MFRFILMLILNVIMYIAGSARFFALCSGISLKKAYLLVYLPIITFIVGQILIAMKLIPKEYSKDFFAICSLFGQTITFYAIMRLMFGKCDLCLVSKKTIPK